MGLASLLPYAALVLSWRFLRGYWGYGVADMGLYIDPIQDPSRFASALLVRAPILLLGQWALPPSDLGAILGPRGELVFWSFAVAVLGTLALAMARLLRQDAMARFWGLGMLLAAIPVCATIPSDRLLTAVGLGAFGLLALFVRFIFVESSSPATGWRARFSAFVAWSLLVVHLVVAPILLPLRAGNPLGPKWIEERLHVPLALGPTSEDQTVVVVNAPSVFHAGYFSGHLELAGLPVPKRTRILAPAIPSVNVLREDAKTLVVRPESGYLSMALDRVFRTEKRPFAVGDRVELPGMNVEITELTSDGRPAEARFRFDRSLEDPLFVWICWRGQGFERLTPPRIGDSVAFRPLGLLAWTRAGRVSGATDAVR
jgi:hypothetical protein